MFFFISCKEKDPGLSIEGPSFVDEPVTVSLDLKDGYKVNPLTGDSIKRYSILQGKLFRPCSIFDNGKGS
jgi:hypothetical protein